MAELYYLEKKVKKKNKKMTIPLLSSSAVHSEQSSDISGTGISIGGLISSVTTTLITNWFPVNSTVHTMKRKKYSKFSKISNTSCLSQRPRQTEQIQIRLLLKEQSDQSLTCLLFQQALCEF